MCKVNYKGVKTPQAFMVNGECKGGNMIEEITKLDCKYVVVKRGDISKYLTETEATMLATILSKITEERMRERKEINSYAVINRNDNIDAEGLMEDIDALIHATDTPNSLKIGDNQIDVMIINAILRSTEPTEEPAFKRHETLDPIEYYCEKCKTRTSHIHETFKADHNTKVHYHTCSICGNEK